MQVEIDYEVVSDEEFQEIVDKIIDIRAELFIDWLKQNNTT